MSRSKATKLRHRGEFQGQIYVGSPEPRGRFGTLGPPRQEVRVELDHVVLEEDLKRNPNKKKGACLGRGLGTPVSVRALPVTLGEPP